MKDYINPTIESEMKLKKRKSIIKKIVCFPLAVSISISSFIFVKDFCGSVKDIYDNFYHGYKRIYELQNDKITYSFLNLLNQQSKEKFLKKMVLKNQNIDKKYIPVFNKVIETLDEIEYVNYAKVASTLETLKVNFSSDQSIYVTGSYNFYENEIILFENNALTHEILHSYFNCLTDKNIIKEGITSLIDKEWYGEKSGYNKEEAIVKILELILGKEVLLKNNSNDNDMVLDNELLKYINEEELSHMSNVLKETFVIFGYRFSNEKIWNDLKQIVNKTEKTTGIKLNFNHFYNYVCKDVDINYYRGYTEEVAEAEFLIASRITEYMSNNYGIYVENYNYYEFIKNSCAGVYTKQMVEKTDEILSCLQLVYERKYNKSFEQNPQINYYVSLLKGKNDVELGDVIQITGDIFKPDDEEITVCTTMYSYKDKNIPFYTTFKEEEMNNEYNYFKPSEFVNDRFTSNKIVFDNNVDNNIEKIKIGIKLNRNLSNEVKKELLKNIGIIKDAKYIDWDMLYRKTINLQVKIRPNYKMSYNPLTNEVIVSNVYDLKNMMLYMVYSGEYDVNGYVSNGLVNLYLNEKKGIYAIDSTSSIIKLMLELFGEEEVISYARTKNLRPIIEKTMSYGTSIFSILVLLDSNFSNEKDAEFFLRSVAKSLHGDELSNYKIEKSYLDNLYISLYGDGRLNAKYVKKNYLTKEVPVEIGEYRAIRENEYVISFKQPYQEQQTIQQNFGNFKAKKLDLEKYKSNFNL